MNYIVAPYLIDDLRVALSAASALTAGERKPVEHQWRGKEGGVMLEKARDALETAADKILSDYRIWIADDTEANPRYGQVPEYDMVNAVSGEIDRHLRSSALEATPPAPAGQPVTLTYKNWRGEISERTITPKRVWFGSTDWHPEPQWLVTAFDAEKQADRDFALKDFGATPPAPKVAYRAPVDDEELQRWADLRADDAGRLARELISYRRTVAPASKVTDEMVEDCIMPVVRQALADYAHSSRNASVWEMEARILSALTAALSGDAS